MEPITVTIDDACDIIGIGRSKLYEMVRTGELRAVKVGGRSLIVVASIRAAIERAIAASAAA